MFGSTELQKYRRHPQAARVAVLLERQREVVVVRQEHEQVHGSYPGQGHQDVKAEQRERNHGKQLAKAQKPRLGAPDCGLPGCEALIVFQGREGLDEVLPQKDGGKVHDYHGGADLRQACQQDAYNCHLQEPAEAAL
eukprot:869593-Heterocapsa_arctica.AAC.1